jgi:hypothetical protein
VLNRQNASFFSFCVVGKQKHGKYFLKTLKSWIAKVLKDLVFF